MTKLRKLLTSTVALSVAFAPMANANQYFFRYATEISTKPSVPPEQPEEEYGLGNDITAWYVAPVGVPFAKSIPVATHDVVAWVKDSGAWPAGVVLDAATGAMSGAPTADGKNSLLYHGYDAQGHRIARARLNFTTFTPVGVGQQVDAYAHTNTYFYKEIPIPSGVDVYRWEPVGEMPSGVTMLGNAVQGTPTSAGQFGFAWRGFDYTGREIAYAYGDLLVEDGPSMDFIGNQIVQIDDAWEFNLTPTVLHPVNPVRFRLVAETAQPSGLTFNGATGHVGGAYSWYDLSATYHIVAKDLVDGTEAKSNSFVLATAPKILDLASQMDDITVPVGKAFAQKVSVRNLPANAEFSLVQGTWPAGVTIDKTTGLISGTPTTIELQKDLIVAVSGPSMQTVQSAPFDFSIVAEQIAASAEPLVKRVGKSFTTAGIRVKDGNVAPLSFAAEGTLPAGLSIDPSTGAVSAPQGLATAGSFGVPVVVTNGDGQKATVVQPVDVFDALDVQYATTVVKRLAPVSVSPQVPASAIYGTAKYEIASGDLPSWLSLDAKTGVLRGTPVATSTVGLYGPFTVKLSDSTGESSAPSSPFTVTVDERAALAVNVVNGQVERFVPNQKVTLAAANAYGKAVFSHVSGSLGGTLSITSDGILVGATDDVVGTVYSGLVYDASDSDSTGVTTQPFSISVVDPAPLTPLAGSLDKTLKWTRGLPIPAGVLPLPEVKNGYGAIAYAFAAAEPDLAIDPQTHTVTGTIQQTGTTTHAYRISDETVRAPATGVITLEIVDPMDATIAATTDVRRGSAATIAPVVGNAIGKVTWGAISGALPQGMTFVNGVISGVPRVEGSYPVAFNLTDDAGNVATASTTIVVGPALPFSVSWDDQSFVLGFAATKSPKVDNPLGKVSYKLVSGALPPGISLVETGALAGVFAGTPTVAGRFKNIVVSATDSGIDPADPSDDLVYPSTIELDVTLTGNPVFADQTLSVRKGASFTQPLAATNLVRPAAFESASGSALPYDLVLNRTTGTVTGSFAATGTYGPIAIKVTDDMARTAQANVRFDVLDAFSLQTPSSATFTQFVAGKASPQPVNKIGPVSYEVTAGALPGGLSLDASSGAVEGKASETGDFSGIVVTATDADGSVASTNPFNVHVDPRPVLTLDLPTSYEFNQFFQGRVSATGSNVLDKATWSITPALPSWASFSNGVISGISDIKAAASTYTVTLKDDHDTVSKQIAISVGDRKPLDVTTPTTLAALMDYNYSQKLVAKDALGTVVWTLRSGTLPAGLVFDASSGSFQGKPTEFGLFSNIVVEATDDKGGFVSKTFTIDVKHDQSPIDLTVAAANAHTGLAIKTVLPTLANAIGQLSFSASGLGAGLSIDPDTGEVKGTPTAAGVYQASVTVSDVTGRSATKTQTITVLPPVGITAPSGAIQLVYNRDPSSSAHAAATNAIPANTWSLASGTLPAGLSIDPGTGQFSGLPKATGDFGPVTVKVVDSLGGTATSAPMNLHVEMNSDPIILAVTDYMTYLDKPITTARPTFDNELGAVTFFSPDVSALGLSINPSTGVITGSIGTLTDAYVNVSIRDAGTQRVTSQPLHLKVVPELRITYPTLLTTSQGGALSQAASIGNNIGTISYKKGAGVWPADVTVNAQTGAITGTDITADAKTYDGLTVAADVTFNGGQKDTQGSNAFTIKVGPIQATPVISDINSTATNRALLFTVGTAGTPAKPTVVDSAKGKPWTYSGTTYALNHDLKTDTGLDFNTSTGVISGTATKPIIYKDLTIAVTSAQGDSDVTLPFWFGVQPAGPIVATAGQPTWYGLRSDATTVVPGPKFDNTYGKLAFVSLQNIVTDFDAATGAYTQRPFATSQIPSQPAGGYPEDVRVTDEFGRTGVFSAKWELMYALTMTTTAKATVDAGKPNSVNVPTVGGLYATKSFTGSGMPAGMTINAATGALEGTPSVGDLGATYTVTVTVKDSKDGATKSSTYTVSVVSGPLTATAGQNYALKFRMDVDAVYSFKFDNAYGAVTYSQPAGYSSTINPVTGVVTTKAPFPANTYTGPSTAWTGNTYSITDALGRTATITYSVTNVYGITMSSASTAYVSSGVANTVNAPVVANVYGTKSFAGTGMPTGMTINPTTGALQGTPLAADEGKSFTVSVTVTDGYDNATKTTTYTASVIAPLKAAAGQPTQFYGRTGGTLATTAPVFVGGFGALTYTLVTQPGGLKIDATTGKIVPLTDTSGFVPGVYPVLTRATDTLGRTADLSATITTVGALSMTVPATVTLVVGSTYGGVSPPTITNKAAPAFVATGLPAGVTVDPTTGGLTGTPTVAGSYPISLTLTDVGATVTKSFTLNVIP
jgi:hypothetical protein